MYTGGAVYAKDSEFKLAYEVAYYYANGYSKVTRNDGIVRVLVMVRVVVRDGDAYVM